ncbi:alpha/beta hydrolase [Mannheimia sp. AT1]|uniref:Alpha/beta hydrolase n=1 Tax=Mannheimia cairinae TaxID=3025936 RepID=A0ABT5MTC2_9PAST|nr:alpha/beta hydrolase [Mannheimia cairinae]MDD0824861.1 alpha/beta hydrolase [Mannheimia cairinae]MDD0826209.1 alpha/beta hydrolase [Mannheimia cairinae]
MTTYRTAHLLAPEYRDISANEVIPAESFNLDNIREVQKQLIAQADKDPIQPDSKWIAPAKGNQPAVDMYVYYPKTRHTSTALPVIYYSHGGGYVMGNARLSSPMLFAIAEETGAVVVSLEYRVASETPFPAQINDAYYGLSYLIENADTLGINRDKIVLMGESGGGGLTANLSLMVRDKNTFSVAGQVLIYPMLDCRTGGEHSLYQSKFTGEFIWTPTHNQTAWQILRGSQNIAQNQISYYSASLASDVSHLPPTCIITASMDLFVNENLDFANRLIEAGVPTELHIISGVYHGFDHLAPNLPQAQNLFKWRNEAIQRMIA